MISIALGIPHTPWIAARVESLMRLVDGITPTPREVATHRVFPDRAPNWAWSEQMWRWGAETDATHFLTLQDDAIVAPNFWPALRAMLEAVPDQIIALEAVHPAGKTIARAGEHRWYTTADGLIGVGYVMPRSLLQEFLRWRAQELVPGAVEAITEDTLIDVFAIARGMRIWHPCPTIIDHDLSIDSTYGNDKHSHRRPSVLWSDGDVCGWSDSDLESVEWWRPKPGLPHLGRFYARTHWSARMWVRGFQEETWQRAEGDSCPAEYGRWV